MNREQAKQDAKNRLPEYLDMITTKKGNQYVCPVCRSGTGKNKTPAGQLNTDNQTFHCYSCDFHGDIFNLVAKVEGIINESEKFMRVYEILNIQIEQPYKKVSSRSNAQPQSESRTDYTLYFKECNVRAGETDYFSFRGLTETVIYRRKAQNEP